MSDDTAESLRTGVLVTSSEDQNELVHHLRQRAFNEAEDWPPHPRDADLLAAAADEIERLRSAGDRLIACMKSGSDYGWDTAIELWEKARRD